ncbi:MAG: TfoX/Sxy family protein [Cellvibrio sp.]|jgi:DNA transformation protein
MAVSTHYVARAIECMARVAPVSYRRIFHGVGVYHRSVLFALIVNDRLYFRVDEHSRALYEQQGLRPFQPAAAERAESAFYEVPESILEQPSVLLQWMRTAVEAGRIGYPLEQDEPHIDAPVRHLQVR